MAARWHNCKQLCSQFRCSFSHVLREGNTVAHALSKNGQALAMHSSQWWPSPPLFFLTKTKNDIHPFKSIEYIRYKHH